VVSHDRAFLQAIGGAEGGTGEISGALNVARTIELIGRQLGEACNALKEQSKRIQSEYPKSEPRRIAAMNLTRRKMLWSLVGAGASAHAQQPGVNKNSAPSQLKITDMRAVTIAANYDYPIIRIDTNQGVYGLGEVRDAGVKGIALILKAHLLGKNPLQIEANLARDPAVRRTGRMGGGYSAVDMALHDIAGKVYGVPAYRLIGSKQRDRIRIYCDTTGHTDPKIYGQRMLARKKLGFTFFKMDLYTSMVKDRPGAINDNGAATEKGLGYLCEYIAAVRDAIGWDAPLGADHFGRLSVNDSIRYARAFEPYQLAWAEDFIPWKNWRGYKQISDSTTTPILTGEDIFGLEEGFQTDRQPGRRHHPSRSGNFGCAHRNQAHRRLRARPWHSDCGPFRGIARGMYGFRPHGVHVEELRFHGESRHRYAVVAGPGDRRREADHPRRLYSCAGDAGVRR
jgi:hypothetical protein